MDQLQLLTYISEAVLDKSPRVVIYQVLKKKVCPPFSPRRNQTKPLPEIALNRSQPVQTCTVQLGEIGPSSPGKHPNRVLPVSLAEPRGKTQARARSPSLPGSLLHLATPRHVPGIPRDPSQLIFIKHPLSTPHRGVGHCSTVAALPAASRSPELSGPGELELPQTPHSSSSFLLLGSHKVRSKIVWHIGLRIGSCVTLPFSVIFATPNCPSCVHCTAGSLLQSPLHNHTSPTHDGGFYCFRQDLSDLGLCCSF